MCSGDPAGRATNAMGLPSLDDDSMLEAMRAIRAFDGLIGLHAENHSILIGARTRLVSAGRHDPAAHAEAGPELAEIEAVGRVLLYARETGVRCHIVHLSSATAAEMIKRARPDTRISVETCPQYLLLTEADLIRVGADARCGPPLRKPDIVAALWDHVLAGDIDMLASDHCPYLPEQKKSGAESIWEAGMGLTGIETSVPLFFSGAVQARGLSLVDFARMTATAPARLFGLSSRKGAIAVGLDADLALYDPDAEWTIRGTAFQGLAKWSAFEGMTCRGRVVRTLVRGVTVYDNGDFPVEPGQGRFQPRDRRVS
jgi:allantoinase